VALPGGRTSICSHGVQPLIALTGALLSAVADIGYWSWRVCHIYHTTLPFIALLTLERLIYLSRAVSIVAIECLLIGRGPYRVQVLLAVLWVTLQLWVHDGIIHWTGSPLQQVD